MIEWMQTHRRWLVITIWIATIAFIGAGFVGWGQFKLGQKSSVIAEVKDTPVTIKDVQNTYQNIYQFYNKQMGGKLDEATAKKMGLQNIALQQAVQDAILRQYAKDLGLCVTADDIAKKILEVFGSKQKYQFYLRNMGMKPKDFEENLKKQILVSKLFKVLNIKPSKTLLLSTASALFNADNVEFKILKKENVKVSLSQNEIKKFWETHKNQFLTNKKYKIALVKIPLKTNASIKELQNFYKKNKLNYKNVKGEILSFKDALNKVKTDYAAENLKKKAIFAYKKLKANKDNFKIITIEDVNNYFPADKMNTLIKNGIVKPFIYKDSYVSAKLLEEINPKPLVFKKAKALVMEELLNIKEDKALKTLSKKEYKTFKGKETGFITKYDINKLKNLKPNIAAQFLQQLFISQNSNHYILLPVNNPKISILYRIKEQKLLDTKEYQKSKKLIFANVKSTLGEELIQNLLTNLEQTYKIKQYIKMK